MHYFSPLQRHAIRSMTHTTTRPSSVRFTLSHCARRCNGSNDDGSSGRHWSSRPASLCSARGSRCRSRDDDDDDDGIRRAAAPPKPAEGRGPCAAVAWSGRSRTETEFGRASENTSEQPEPEQHTLRGYIHAAPEPTYPSPERRRSGYII